MSVASLQLRALELYNWAAATALCKNIFKPLKETVLKEHSYF